MIKIIIPEKSGKNVNGFLKFKFFECAYLNTPIEFPPADLRLIGDARF